MRVHTTCDGQYKPSSTHKYTMRLAGWSGLFNKNSLKTFARNHHPNLIVNVWQTWAKCWGRHNLVSSAGTQLQWCGTSLLCGTLTRPVCTPIQCGTTPPPSCPVDLPLSCLVRVPPSCVVRTHTLHSAVRYPRPPKCGGTPSHCGLVPSSTL